MRKNNLWNTNISLEKRSRYLELHSNRPIKEILNTAYEFIRNLYLVIWRVNKIRQHNIEPINVWLVVTEIFVYNERAKWRKAEYEKRDRSVECKSEGQKEWNKTHDVQAGPDTLPPFFAKYTKWLGLKCAERNPHSDVYGKDRIISGSTWLSTFWVQFICLGESLIKCWHGSLQFVLFTLFEKRITL
jgi:hypothetical protein